jgi:disulfide bond formation protein DsbB
MDRATALIFVSGFSYLVLFAQIIIAIFAVFLFVRSIDKKNKFVASGFKFVSDNSLSLAFLVAPAATGGSLFFSEIAHFVPCKLCWYQRIFMYPQVILLGIAAVKNDFSIKRYILPLSITGLAIAIYHYALQMSPLPLPCSDELVSCAAKQTAHFGYITIPLMSLTAFLLITSLMFFIGKKK